MSMLDSPISSAALPDAKQNVARNWSFWEATIRLTTLRRESLVTPSGIGPAVLMMTWQFRGEYSGFRNGAAVFCFSSQQTFVNCSCFWSELSALAAAAYLFLPLVAWWGRFLWLLEDRGLGWAVVAGVCAIVAIRVVVERFEDGNFPLKACDLVP